MELETTEKIRKRLNLRTASLWAQLDEVMTPALRKELRHLLDEHRTVLERPDSGLDNDAIKRLDRLYDQLSAHWGQVHDNLTYCSSLKKQMAVYQEFLTEVLREDYLPKKQARVPSAHELQLADRVKQYKAATKGDEKLEKLYREEVVVPIREMALNQAHIEDRLLLAAAAQGQQREHSNNHVQRFIGQRDWKSLARMLLHDRDLAHNLEDKYLDEETRKSILYQIDVIEVVYFTILKSPTDYLTNKHATDLESVFRLETHDQSSPLPTKGKGKAARRNVASG